MSVSSSVGGECGVGDEMIMLPFMGSPFAPRESTLPVRPFFRKSFSAALLLGIICGSGFAADNGESADDMNLFVSGDEGDDFLGGKNEAT